ncbi:MAG: sulfate adenylyltransferase [Candidatus Sumerlaeota bacterium]|nr:sulfate adenylyltransferase [Candidatus Sumerlaeota bacterium]
MTLPLPPHGGASALAERLVSAEKAAELLKKAASAPKVVVTNADLSTVRRFGDGALTPLAGPMTKKVYQLVLDEARIEANGDSWAWGIPLSLPVTDDEKKALKPGAPALLVDEAGTPVAVLDVEDVFDWDKKEYNTKVYGTERQDHPGARIANDDPRTALVGGTIHVFPWEQAQDAVGKYVFSPRQTREKLAAKGWDAAIAFQTRNPLHRAHEYAMVVACERLTAQGLKAGVVLNPLVGETKSDDVPAWVRMQAYENLKANRLLGKGDSQPEVWAKAGYDINDVFDLFALDIKMFYGGPREAIMHAVYRQNYGFSHIIIGRKHADAPFADGTNIWGDFDAQEIFTKLNGRLEIKTVNVGFAAYYEELGRCGLIEEYAPKGWKPVSVAGRILREQLVAGQTPDPRIIRPETSAILIEAYRRKQAQERHIHWHQTSVTRADREKLNGHKGATLWFTGLSGSGKSTIANGVAAVLHERGIRTYVLDGDNIRHGLNKDLGFSPEARVENIRRIGEVAKLFSDGAVLNLTAFISPYIADRQIARELQPESFIEVFVDADLSTCEERDPKGLYKKARAGEIKGFTGIDAPYEAPVKPEIHINTSHDDIDSCIGQIVIELERRGIIPAAK